MKLITEEVEMLQPNSAPQPDGPYQGSSYLVPAERVISAEYHLKLGKNLYHSYLARSHKKDLEEAIRHFQKAVEIEPNLAEAYVHLASALWDQGTINLELAQFYCEVALRIDPNQSEANLFLGYFLQRAGFLEDAAHQYRTAIKKNCWKSSRPRIALGSTLLKQSLELNNKARQISLALEGTAQFLAGSLLLPLDMQTCSLLREALLTDTLIYSLSFIGKGLRKIKLRKLSRKIYAFGTGLMPKEPFFYHLLGDDYLYDEKKPSEAISWYQKAQAMDPSNISLLKKLGKAYADSHDSANAIKILSSLLEMEPNSFDTLYSLGQLYIEEKAFFKAFYYLKEAAKQEPRSPYVHSNMAYILFKLEDIEGAFEEYKTALEYGTDSLWLSTISQTLGTISYQVYHDVDQAMEYIQQSLHYNPENQESLIMLADLYFEIGQMEMAINVYNALLQIDPSNSDCYSNIGYILWQMDRNQAAIDAYMAAIYYDRNNHIAHNNLGVIYLDEESNPEKAIVLFKTALNLKPDYTLACFNSARALEKMGRTMEAAQKYSEALALNQLNPELEDAEIQERINQLFG